MSQVVTELVIDSNTSAAADYERAMDGAAQAAGRATDAAMGYGAAAVAIGAGVVGVAAAAKSFLDYVAEANKGLADMQTLASRVGLTLADFQGVKFGGAVSGLTDPQINAGLERSASLLNDASRNANTLSKELEANGLSVRNANGQLISQNQLLGIAADLVSRAKNPGDQLAIAQMLGFTKEWIPLLQQGSAAMGNLTAEAQKAGAVIDDETVNRAAEFDAQWRKSSVEFSSYMKSALLGLLPFVDDLIVKAGDFVKTIDRDKVERAAQDQLKGLAGDAGFEANNDEIRIGITDDARKALDDFKNATSLWGMIAAGVAAVTGSVTRIPRTYPEGGDPMVSSGKSSGPNNIEDVLKRWDQQQDAEQDAADAAAKGFSNVAGRAGEANDAVDRAINTLRRHAAQQQADADAMGQGVAVQAAYRAAAAETAAIQANQGKITAEQAAAFAKVKAAAIDAAVGLERAKIASDIKFNGATALLSPQDVQIAQQLKGLYPDVANALNSAEASQIRFNTGLKETATAFSSAASPALTDFVMGTKSGGDAIKAFEDQFARSIVNMTTQILIFMPIARALQSILGGGLNFLSLGSGLSTGGLDGLAAIHHTGGIVGDPSMPSRYISPAYFDDAPRFHSGGIVGDEVPIIAKKGEEVGWPDQLARKYGGGAPIVNVTLIESPNGGGSVKQSQNSNGGIDLEVTIAQIAAKSAATPGAPLNRVMTDQLGSQQRLAKR